MILVREDVNLRAREAAAVDDAGVVELIGNDVVFGREHRRDGTGVGGESGLENDAGFHVLELCDAALELHVEVHGAGYGADRARPGAVLAGGLDGGFDELRVRGQPEIVVGREVDDVLAIEARFGGARPFEDAKPLIRAGFFPVGDLVAEVGERVEAGHIRLYCRAVLC